jgi:hypothetical protein
VYLFSKGGKVFFEMIQAPGLKFFKKEDLTSGPLFVLKCLNKLLTLYIIGFKYNWIQ